MNNRAMLFDIIRRSIEGPIMSEKDFDMKHVFKNLKDITKKYEIEVTSDYLINFDDDLADRVWNAAIEFLSKCGVFCKDSGRLIEFSEKEIRDRVKLAPTKAQYGDGFDAVIEQARTPDCEQRCLSMGSSVNIPAPNKYYVPIMMSYLQEPLVDIHCPTTNLTTQNGMELRTRTPLELIASWEEVELFKQTAKLAGRPGICYNGVGIAVSDVGQLAAAHLLGPYDSHCVGIISELKADNSILNKITQAVLLDGNLTPYANPIFGGLGGGLDSQCVLLTAEMIALSVIFLGTTCGTTPTHPSLFCSTTKEILQMISVAFQAISRNSNIMTRLTHTMVGGPGTKTFLYETLASCLIATKSGLSRLQGPRGATGGIFGMCSGLEARFQGEVLHAAVKIDREKAEEITRKAFNAYKDDLNKKPYGKPFWEVYDVETIKPTDEWLKIYEEVKEEAISWGLPID